MTPEQSKHLSGLRDVVLTRNLIECQYVNLDKNCYCIIGHMAKAVGLIDLFAEHNGDGICKVYNKNKEEFSLIFAYYGITIEDMIALQTANDSPFCDSFPSRRKSVLSAIDKLLSQ